MSLTRDCPSCRGVSRSSARTCEECGFDFVTGRPGRARRLKGGEVQPGVLGLAVGTIVHPVRTMDSFFYFVSDTAMLGRMVVFYLVSLPIAGFIAGGAETHAWVQGIFAEAAGFIVSTLCILGAGRLLGQSGSLVGAGVILGFVRAVVSFVLGLYVLAVVTGVTSPHFAVFILFMLWNLVLNIMALTNIFGCSASVALFISIIGGILHGIITRAIGIPT